MNLAAESVFLNGNLPEMLYPPSAIGIVVETNGITDSQSPVTDFIVDEEETSVYPLLPPSPPTEFEHPLAVPSVMGYDHQISPSSTDPELSMIPTANGNVIPTLKTADSHISEARPEIFKPTNSIQSMVDSSSSNSSVLHETAACAQLLSHHYQHFTKATDDPFALQENGGKPVMTGMQLAVHKSTEDYSFLNWNWPLIRKISFWTVLSMLMACVCIVVGMVSQLPTRCDPPHAWWQGNLFYEIFPASFQDYNSDGVGDFAGLIKRANYFESLGVKAVRLNSVFASDHYPDHYEQVKSIINIDESLGTLKDFENIVNSLHERNLSIILDLPLRILTDGFQNAISSGNTLPKRDNMVFNVNDHLKNTNSAWNSLELSTSSSSYTGQSANEDESTQENLISEALSFWLEKRVDGFYLKGLEHLTHQSNFATYLRQWRKIVDKFNEGLTKTKILMCDVKVLHSLNADEEPEKVNSVLEHMDLIDVHLDLFSNGTEGIKRSVDSVMEGLIYRKKSYPWIHWNIGSIGTNRLAALSGSAEGNLAAIMLNMMLPGTPSIFYGDEIGLQSYVVPEGEHREAVHPPQLVPMHWNYNEGFGFTSPGVFPWINPSLSLVSVSENKTDIIRKVAMFREASPSIYMNGVINNGLLTSNCEVRVLDSDILVVQRWYPRRHSYVMVTNLGTKTRTCDLSSWLYGGEIVVGQRSRTGQYVKFDSLTLNARESVIVKLDK